jgi:hypothetical protein
LEIDFPLPNIAKGVTFCFFPAAFSSISQAMWSSRTSALPKS